MCSGSLQRPDKLSVVPVWLSQSAQEPPLRLAAKSLAIFAGSWQAFIVLTCSISSSLQDNTSTHIINMLYAWTHDQLVLIVKGDRIAGLGCLALGSQHSSQHTQTAS